MISKKRASRYCPLNLLLLTVGGYFRISANNFFTFVLMTTSSLRGAFSFKAFRNFLTSTMYCLCKCFRYSEVLSFIHTVSFHTIIFGRYYKLYTTRQYNRSEHSWVIWGIATPCAKGLLSRYFHLCLLVNISIKQCKYHLFSGH